MTVAEELRAAATKLRDKSKPLLEADGDKTWPGEWANFFTLHGADLGLIREDEEWIALMSPALGEPLAAWLESRAKDTESLTDPRNQKIVAGPYALAVARVINGGEAG